MNLKREESVTIKFHDEESGFKGYVTIEASVEGGSPPLKSGAKMRACSFGKHASPASAQRMITVFTELPRCPISHSAVGRPAAGWYNRAEAGSASASLIVS